MFVLCLFIRLKVSCSSAVSVEFVVPLLVPVFVPVLVFPELVDEFTALTYFLLTAPT